MKELEQAPVDFSGLFVLQPVGGVLEEHQLPVLAELDAGLCQLPAQGEVLLSPQDQHRHTQAR
jgi:hypothetical protein